MQPLQQDYIKQLNKDTVYHSITRAINLLLKYVYMLPILFLPDHHIVQEKLFSIVQSYSIVQTIVQDRKTFFG